MNGGTIKRLAMRASLQCPYDNYILSPKDLFAFAKVHVQGIYTFYVTTEEVTKFTDTLEKRYKNGSNSWDENKSFFSTSE